MCSWLTRSTGNSSAISIASRGSSALPTTVRSFSTETCCGTNLGNWAGHSSQLNARCQRACSSPSQNTSSRFGPHVTADGALCNMQPSDSQDQTPAAEDHACHRTLSVPVTKESTPLPPQVTAAGYVLRRPPTSSHPSKLDQCHSWVSVPSTNASTRPARADVAA